MVEQRNYQIILPNGKEIRLSALYYTTYDDGHRFFWIVDGAYRGFALIPLGSAIIEL